MTEAEWLTCDDVKAMLRLLGAKTTERKLRLFAVAGCRSVWHLVKEKGGQWALETAERYAEGSATQHEVIAAYVAANCPLKKAQLLALGARRREYQQLEGRGHGIGSPSDVSPG